MTSKAGSCALLALLVCTVSAVPRNQLYPYGQEYQDTRIEPGDDISSLEIRLYTPILFYDGYYSSLFVNSNGHLTFETEVPDFKSDLFMPIGFKMIAPFLADVDTRLSGQVYYRETADPSILEKVTREIQSHYPDKGRRFRASSAFIATWDSVGYWQQQYDKVNTFQVVIASDNMDSYVVFLYEDSGIQWIKGQGKQAPVFEDIPAQAGFDSGDSVRYLTLPGSGNLAVKQLSSTSNTGTNGMWLFRVGSLDGGDIQEPETYQDGQEESRPGSCVEGGENVCRGMSATSTCVDYQEGFCCECAPPTYGNGLHCINPDDHQRMNGKVSGIVNGVRIESQDLHSYAVTADGRAYTAISRVPASIGIPLQSAYAIGSVVGWLFAQREGPEAKNGYVVTGGEFNRTAIIQYMPGGQRLEIKQRFQSHDVQGFMRVSTTINGDVPDIPAGVEVRLDDYDEEFNNVAPGVIKSYTSHNYKVNDEARQFTVDTTITYKACEAAPSGDLLVSKLRVARAYLTYSENEEIVRYASTNLITMETGNDACTTGQSDCDVNANCIPDGSTYYCECKAGFYGDGRRCIDLDECSQGSHDCDPNASCINTEGSFTCQCLNGYQGDGRYCTRQESCSTANICDPNARCEYFDQTLEYRCVCNPGFYGDGMRCEPEAVEECNTLNNCDANAMCAYDSNYGQYRCQCNSGYTGNGYQCSEETCDRVNFCDVNAQCVYDPYAGKSVCQCNQGFSGDGRYCEKEGDCSLEPELCDENAQCVQRGYTYVCQCNDGYQGDGKRCGPTGDSDSYLMFAQGNYIMQMPFQPTEEDKGTMTLMIKGQTAVAIAVDCFSRYFYWSDVSGKTISRAKLDGSDSEVLLTGLGSPEGIAVDWLARNMYWTDSKFKTIEVASLDGVNRKSIISSDLKSPRAIVADPPQGLIFWSDWNRKSPKIEKSEMDGSGRQVVVSENLGLPNGLTLDYYNHLLCWADAGTQHVECVDYNGERRQILYSLAAYPFDITYHNNVFYWSDWHMMTLPSVDRYGGVVNEPLELPEGGNGRLYGITTVPEECPAGSNACAHDNGGCRFICLPGPNRGRTCACPDNVPEEECNQILFL